AQLTVAVLSHGSADDNSAAAAEHGIERLLLAGELDPLYSQVAGVTPSALLISRDGDVAAPVARGPAAIRALVGDALGSTDPISHSIGDPAPQLGLSDLSGAPVVLPVVEGRDTLLLFWNPACGHCEHMLGELRALELEQPPEAP